MAAEVLPDEEEFRRQARAFLSATLPAKGATAAMAPSLSGIDWARDYQHRLADAGFAGITWPEAYGGRGLPSSFQRLFDREATGYVKPPQALEIGLGMCGPTILAHGTEHQKRALIPPLLRGDEVWCELFSEPGAGSDLASVQMRAVRDGDAWVLTGQKVWTSGAQHSDRAACLARTDPDRPKHEGITMFIVDLRSPGVTVRPLRQITGDAHFNEVFLDGVCAGDGDVLGDVNDGWRVARTMLAFERRALATMGSGGGGRGGTRAVIEAARGRGHLERPEMRQRLADLRVRQMVLRYLAAHLEARRGSGQSKGGEASLLKLAMAQLMQDSASLAVEVVGPGAVAWDENDPRRARWAAQLLNAPSSSIGGGTNEIIRNVIAEQVLGLPRDIEVDAGVAFRDLKVGTQRGG